MPGCTVSSKVTSMTRRVAVEPGFTVWPDTGNGRMSRASGRSSEPSMTTIVVPQVCRPRGVTFVICGAADPCEANAARAHRQAPAHRDFMERHQCHMLDFLSPSWIQRDVADSAGKRFALRVAI